jgi:ATP-binding cassette subfamily F protein uup
MPELQLKDVTVTFGGAPLLDGVDLVLDRGERVCLVGRNGAGKSTFLRVLTGELEPDGGEVAHRQGLRVGSLSQEVPPGLAGTVGELLAAELARAGMTRAWDVEKRIGQACSRLAVDPASELGAMSAGALRRALLARAMAAEPDVLVLDEPTNHLDIAAILELEEHLARWEGTLVFVTHDRAFLRRLATRILDLDRGTLMSYPCGYDRYLERREAALAAEAEARAQFDKKLAQEEAWIRRGVQARRRRNMGRVRALEALRAERRARREMSGAVRARVQEAGRTGQLVFEVLGLSHSLGGVPLIRDLTTLIQRGDRIGIVGPNGCGKTTLVRLLLGELSPDRGTLRRGTHLAVASFDQLGARLDDSKTVRENVCDEGDTVTVGGVARHVVSYLSNFLFTPEQIRGSLSVLSGGERKRVQLARLLAQPCNVLVLDEPTNDLDLETLEVLEDLLAEFQGTLLLVSHDRAFLENVVTSTLVFEGDGVVREVVGGPPEPARPAAASAPAKARRKPAAKPPARPSGGERRATYGEELELAALPEKLEALEAERDGHNTAMAAPGFYEQDRAAIDAAVARLKELEERIATAYARWEELERLAGG